MRGLHFLAVIGGIILLSQIASAEIALGEMREVYSLGDVMSFNVTIRSSSGDSDYLLAKLICPNGAMEVYRNPVTLSAGESRTTGVSLVLNKNLVQILRGNCTIRGSYGGQESESRNFELSSSILIDVDVDGSPASPREGLLVRGSAVKISGSAINGLGEVSFDEDNSSVNTFVTNGSFVLNISVPEDMAAGNHFLRVKVVERDGNGDILNEGFAEAGIVIRAIIRSVDIDMDRTETNPNESISFNVVALDQTGNRLSKDATYSIYFPDGRLLRKGLSRTDERQSIDVAHDASPGYWKIESQIGEHLARKLYYVKEFEKAEFDVVNGTLVVRNNGNVAYKKNLEIIIGNHSQIVDVILNVGQAKRYKLSAPDSVYEVLVRDGSAVLSSWRVPLTGRAIGVGEISDSAIGRFGAPAAVIFFLVLASLAIAMNIIVKRRQGYIGNTSLGTSGTKALPRVGIPSSGDSVKENASIMVLRAKALGDGRESLNNALSKARKAGAHVYQDGTDSLMIFSPKLTRKNENELLAAQLANEMSKIFDEHNKKMKNKIEYGIGIGKGEVVIENRDKGRNVTSLGTLVPGTKRLASAAKNEVLLSDDVQKMLMSAVKTEKIVGRDAWKMVDVVNREQHKGFIDSFLKRQG